MKNFGMIVVALLATASMAVAGPIKGLIDMATGQEVPDADLRYASAGASGLTTNDSATMATGTYWIFSLASVTNNATNGIGIVNYQTMTNWVAQGADVMTNRVSFPNGIYVAGQLIDGTVGTISVANVEFDVDWLPTALVSLGSASSPLDGVYANKFVATGDPIQTNQKAVAFAASTSEDFAHTNLTADTFDLVRGRLWVSDTNNNPVDATATLTWYTDSNMRGENAIYRADLDLIQVLVNGAVVAGNNTVTVDDASSLAIDDLVVIYDSDSTEYGRISDILGNVVTLEDNLVSNVADNAGFSRVAEYGGFSLYGTNNTVWGRITFSSAQTMNLANWLEYK